MIFLSKFLIYHGEISLLFVSAPCCFYFLFFLFEGSFNEEAAFSQISIFWYYTFQLSRCRLKSASFERFLQVFWIFEFFFQVLPVVSLEKFFDLQMYYMLFISSVFSWRTELFLLHLILQNGIWIEFNFA